MAQPTCKHSEVYALVDAAVRLKDEQPCVLHKFILESCQEVVIVQHLLTLPKLHLNTSSLGCQLLAYARRSLLFVPSARINTNPGAECSFLLREVLALARSFTCAPSKS